MPQIDTMEDLLATEKPVLMGGKTIMTRLLHTDPRPSAKALKQKVTYFDVLPGGVYPKPVWDR